MNRQQRPRPNRGGQAQPRNSRGANVPTTAQVVPGAAVSIVLKADQPTGREVQGTVKDLLTRGEHPRGIKVRLQDGKVGRVQRMATGGLPAPIVESEEGDGRDLWTKIRSFLRREHLQTTYHRNVLQSRKRSRKAQRQ
ncbi:uncharacterized protein LTR77_003500 [Saxophila tyrrhenica]|uniref:YwbE family protein n=1 Tax=Saxophila tyrrhenica TaxID=1690608 RepID=A0AAV9PI53_9PEZI|nr:hypothetical protein LTR77_003500 [Saxophila tyrrhenica]